MPFAHQVGAQFGKLALPELRKPLVEFLASHQRQHGIAQELQLLIVADLVLAVPSLLRFLLAGLRTVRYRLLNHRAPPEVIPESQFQRRDFPFLHTWRQLESKCPAGTAAVGCPASAARPAQESCQSPQFFTGAALCPGAVPLFSLVSRSCSARAALPAAESGRSLVRSTA